MQHKKTSGRFALMGKIIDEEFVMNRRTNKEHTTANEKLACCAMPKKRYKRCI